MGRRKKDDERLTYSSGAVMDGTYLNQPWLVVNSTGQSSNISVITGINRDEAGVLVDDYPENSTTLGAYAAKALKRYNLSPSFLPSILPQAPFAMAANSSSPAQILNVTLAVSTDGEFGCFDQAKAYAGAKHGAFKAVWAYEFNRTYQTSGYTRAWCVPPKSASHPLGDLDGEYYKCHAGEQLVVFGNVRRAGLPDRDGYDVPFMQLVVDYWAAFARGGDPNPDPAWLTTRGHWNTLNQMASRGSWEPVRVADPTMRVLQWNGHQLPLADQQKCAALGIPLDVLDTESAIDTANVTKRLPKSFRWMPRRRADVRLH